MLSFESAGTSIDGALDAFVSTTSSNMITGIGGLVLAGVTLYFTVYGYMVMFGHIQEPFFEFLKKAGKILLVVSLALGVGSYQSNIVDSFRGLESGLSTIVQNGSASNVYQILDNTLREGLLLAQKAFENANNSSVMTAFGTVAGWFLTGLIISLATLMITAVAAGYIILAKVALSMLFGIGPIFIMCLLFPPVVRFFDAWAGQVITYTLVIVLMATAMAFALKIFNGTVSQIDFNAATSEAGSLNMVSAGFELLAIVLALMIVVFQIPTIAAALGGGFGLSMLNPLRATTTAARGLRNLVNPISVRRDMKTGHMESASRMQHMRSGNTVSNPAYSRRLYENLRTGWGGWNKRDHEKEG
ncbi:MAG: Type IV secretion system protein VirB6 [Syntrophorhabdus sp. PtaU1.Bin153]|nr:MAG: Type IV secretion system protein VirB6 [Syntrophorhabdus sp. PtaU1.Bin153]